MGRGASTAASGFFQLEAGDDLAPDRERVLVVERLVVGHAADARVDGSRHPGPPR